MTTIVHSTPGRPACAVPGRAVRRRRIGLLAAALFSAGAAAAPVSPEELATLCGNAEDAAHCGRLVEEVQLKRLPSLAVRDGLNLRVSLYPSGSRTFTDVEQPSGGRSHSLWDYLAPINAVLLYTTVDETVTFTLLQRATGRQVELPAEPKVAPDRQWLVTADFCPTRCVNELAVWKIAPEGITRELVWKPAEAWDDAVATWKDEATVRVEYTVAGTTGTRTLERKLADPSWTRVPARP
jgi:hypothetical protein